MSRFGEVTGIAEENINIRDHLVDIMDEFAKNSAEGISSALFRSYSLVFT